MNKQHYGQSRVVDNILAHGADGPEFGLRVIPVRLTSPLFTRRQHLLNEMYKVVGTLQGHLAVKFDSCDIIRSYYIILE